MKWYETIGGAGNDLATMLPTRKAKTLLIDLLLAASPNQHGLRDVITGCAHALEPAFEGAGRVCPVEFNISAMVFRAVEDEDEETVAIVSDYLDHESYILLPTIGEPGADGERKGWIVTESGRD